MVRASGAATAGDLRSSWSLLSAPRSPRWCSSPFDPVDLPADLDDGHHRRRSGLRGGFFFFWMLCAGCSAATYGLARARDETPNATQTRRLIPISEIRLSAAKATKRAVRARSTPRAKKIYPREIEGHVRAPVASLGDDIACSACSTACRG